MLLMLATKKSPKSEKAKITFLLRGLEFELKNKEEFEKIIKEKTELELTEKNYGEIVARLEVLFKEKMNMIIKSILMNRNG